MRGSGPVPKTPFLHVCGFIVLVWCFSKGFAGGQLMFIAQFTSKASDMQQVDFPKRVPKLVHS